MEIHMTSRTLLLALAAIAPAIAQMQNNQERTLSCTDNYGGDQAHFCEMREQTIASAGRLSIDPGPNGGVSARMGAKRDGSARGVAE